jgi:hypothetical protein
MCVMCMCMCMCVRTYVHRGCMVWVLPSQWKVVLGSVHPPVGTPHYGVYAVGCPHWGACTPQWGLPTGGVQPPVGRVPPLESVQPFSRSLSRARSNVWSLASFSRPCPAHRTLSCCAGQGLLKNAGDQNSDLARESAREKGR